MTNPKSIPKRPIPTLDEYLDHLAVVAAAHAGIDLDHLASVAESNGNDARESVTAWSLGYATSILDKAYREGWPAR